MRTKLKTLCYCRIMLINRKIACNDIFYYLNIFYFLFITTKSIKAIAKKMHIVLCLNYYNLLSFFTLFNSMQVGFCFHGKLFFSS